MRHDARLTVVLSLVSILAGSVAAQFDVVGHVHGRVVSAYGLVPVVGAAVRIVVQRDGRAVQLSQSSTDERGRYRLPMGAVFELPHLVIQADDFAPRVVPIRETPDGAGLVLDDLILDVGQPLTVQLENPADFRGRKTLKLCIPFRDSRSIDLDGRPLDEVAFDEKGSATLLQVPVGPCRLLVGDGFSSFVPRLLVWRQDVRPVVLPPVRLEVGRSLGVEVLAGTEQRLAVSARMGAGVWDPDGGSEYTLLWRTGADSRSPGRFVATIHHLPPAVVEMEFRAQEFVGRFAQVPSGIIREVSLALGTEIKGRVRALDSPQDVVGARVQLGSQLVETDAAGRFLITGVLPGSYTVRITHPLYDRFDGERIVVTPETRVAPLEVRLRGRAALRGTVRNGALDLQPGTFVGVAAAGETSPWAGRRIHAVSDDEGAYFIRAVPGGQSEVYAVPFAGLIPVVANVELTPGLTNQVDVLVDQGAWGDGEIRKARGGRHAGADVFLIDERFGPDMLLASEIVPRLAPPRVVHTLTSSEGRYHFSGVEPGRYHLLVRPPAGPPTYGGVIGLASGKNTIGLDWTVYPVPPLELDLAAGVAYRLAGSSPELPSRWLVRMDDRLPFLLTDVIPGNYRLAPIYPWGSPLTKRSFEVSYGGELRDELVIDVTVPSSRVRPPPPEVPKSAVRGVATLNGDSIGDVGIEVTLYPISAVAGLPPLRLDLEAETGEFEILLPRGTWLAVGRSPGFGLGFGGPFTVGTGEEDQGRVEVVLDLVPGARILGNLALPRGLDLSGEPVRVAARVAAQRWTGLWRLPLVETDVRPDGSFDLQEFPAGPAELVVSGAGLHRTLPVDIEPIGFLSIRNLALESAAVLELRDLGPAESRFRLRSEDRGGRTDRDGAEPRAGLVTTPPGTYELELLDGFSLDDGFATSRRRRLLHLGPGENVVSLAPANRLATHTLKQAIRIDTQRLTNWPLEIVPLQRDAYDYTREALRFRSEGAFGGFELERLESGPYAVLFSYPDGDGTPCSWSMQVELTDDRVVRLRSDFRTGGLRLRVTQPDQRTPIEGALVRIQRAGLRGRTSESVFLRDTATICEGYSDSRGRVRFDRLIATAYDVVVTSDRHGAGRLKSVLIILDGTTEHAIPLEPRGRLMIELREADGRPLPFATVFVFDEDGAEPLDHRLWLTDAGGRVTVGGLPSGTFRVIAQSPRHAAQVVGDVQLPLGGTGSLVGSLELGCELLVETRDAAGRPLAGVRVDVVEPTAVWRRVPVGASRAEELPEYTDGAGTWLIRAFPAGNYTLEARIDGYLAATASGFVAAGGAERVVLVLEKKVD